MNDLPASVSDLVAVLTAMPGATAVVLGGSRALGSGVAASDWDLGLYYRDRIDLAALTPFGEVYPPGSWGRLMNGGAWLKLGDIRVDVLLRDLNVVEHWTRQAEEGLFEVDALLGYLAGAPTYLLSAELSSCRVLAGEIPSAPFPSQLRQSAPASWRFRRSFSLAYARKHAGRGSGAGVLGQAAKAVMEEANARACDRSQWVCNEKQLLETIRMADAEQLLTEVPPDPSDLPEWVAAMAGALGEAPEDRMPFD